MKLLIVDDEKLTREGLLSSIDWKSLGITQVFQADDGLNGLHTAQAEKPDIILCDVRMPRMDGIKMVERLEGLLPDATVIFMSGYSDKEYLKAAIKLKAVNYVEKPLNPDEIREAVVEAKERVQQRLRTRQSEAVLSLETVSALALALTRPYREQKESITGMAEELSLPLAAGTCFTAYLVKLRGTTTDMESMDALRQSLEGFLKQIRLQALYVFKQDRYHVFHLFGPGEPSKQAFSELDRHLTALYQPYGPFLIARGETVSGISRAYQSYASAVTLMQSGFFFDCGKVLCAPVRDSEGRDTAPELPENLTAAFEECLTNLDQVNCGRLLEQVFSACYQRRDLFSHWAKDLYYKLFMALQESRQKLRLPSEAGRGVPQSVMEYLEECFTFRELHDTLIAGTAAFFEDARSHAPEDSTIFLIKEYIAKHYSDETLSVREISEHVFLSASYVCTYFKNETGQTLNQYLTDYRIEKAKQLLSDPRYQIADISDKVGYSNGNYFGKSFKKLVGLSPSEYREKMLQ